MVLGVCLGLTMACSASPASLGPTAKPLVYVAIGASDTVGVGAADPAREGWVPLLHRRLPPDTRLVNLGISGSLLRDALVQQLPVALDAEPDLVTIWLAVNDFNARIPLDMYSTQLDELLGRLARETSARILIANVPDLTRVPVYAVIPPELLRAEVLRWNGVIAAAAERHGATVVDLYPLTFEVAVQPELVARDGFHPSAEGYRRLAEVMWTAIETNQLLP